MHVFSRVSTPSVVLLELNDLGTVLSFAKTLFGG